MTSWLPQYQQFGSWHDMTLQTSTIELMPEGKIKATGTDEVGKFTFDGAFDKKDTTFKFIKHYIGQHTIYYEGKFNKKNFQFEGFWGFSTGIKQGGFRMRKI